MTSQTDKLVSDLKVSSKEVETLKVWLANAKKKRDELNEQLSQEIGELKRVKNRETGFPDQQIFVHSKDVEGTLPSVGDCVEAIVRRRDDGKLRAYEVTARPDPEKIHAALVGVN